ncbi:MAG: hypothetical protein U0790_18645 [Isosphaeraceae bacterium]
MPWHARVLPDLPVIEICYSGIVTAAELKAALQETLKMAAEHRIERCLGDLTRMESGHSCVDLYQLGEELASVPGSRNFREALVTPCSPNAAVDAKFWETLCYNRGLQVRSFPDRGSALDWLMA